MAQVTRWSWYQGVIQAVKFSSKFLNLIFLFKWRSGHTQVVHTKSTWTDRRTQEQKLRPVHYERHYRGRCYRSMSGIWYRTCGLSRSPLKRGTLWKQNFFYTPGCTLKCKQTGEKVLRKRGLQSLDTCFNTSGLATAQTFSSFHWNGSKDEAYACPFTSS